MIFSDFFLLHLLRAPEQLAQRKTETHCGMPGAHGANVHALVEEGLRIHWDAALAASKWVNDFYFTDGRIQPTCMCQMIRSNQ